MNDNNTYSTKLLYAIAAWCRGDATNADQQIVNNWIHEKPENSKILSYLMHTKFMGNVDESDETKERVYAHVLELIQDYEEHETQIVSISKWRTPQWAFVLKRLAVAVVLLLIVSGGVFWYLQSHDNIELVAYGKPNSVVKLTLDDGSVVMLNAGSTLSYPQTFTGKEHRVALSGEAMFKVKPNAHMPFIVNVGDAEIKVLGTQFNVSAYTDSKNIVTTLLDGSVEFYVHSGQENPIRLKPNQQVVYDKVARTSQLREVEAELYASWKDGVLYFDHVGLEEMSKILAHRFGIRIEIHAKNLQNETFSGMFENDMSLYQILDVLKRHRGFDYRKDGDYIVIFDK